MLPRSLSAIAQAASSNAFVAALGLLAGCSEPRFAARSDAGCDAGCEEPYDGGTTDHATDAAPGFVPHTDAGPGDGPSDSAVPEWQENLMGRYAALIYTFATDGIVDVRSEELVLADIVRVGGNLEMHIATCESTSESFGIPGTTRLLNAEAIPQRTLAITYDGQHWNTRPNPITIGYSNEPLVPCTPGERVPRAPEQVWLKNTCLCPSTTNPPTSAEDCRVQDPDKDSQPGMTVRVDAAIKGNFFGVLHKRDHFVKGTFDKGGAAFANVVSDGTVQVFGCTTAPCALTAPWGCNPAANQADFVPLEGRTPPAEMWDCERLRSERKTLFPQLPPIFPPDC